MKWIAPRQRLLRLRPPWPNAVKPIQRERPFDIGLADPLVSPGHIVPITQYAKSSCHEIVVGELGQHRLEDEIDERRRHGEVELAIGIGADRRWQPPRSEPLG